MLYNLIYTNVFKPVHYSIRFTYELISEHVCVGGFKQTNKVKENTEEQHENILISQDRIGIKLALCVCKRSKIFSRAVAAPPISLCSFCQNPGWLTTDCIPAPSSSSSAFIHPPAWNALFLHPTIIHASHFIDLFTTFAPTKQEKGSFVILDSASDFTVRLTQGIISKAIWNWQRRKRSIFCSLTRFWNGFFHFN